MTKATDDFWFNLSGPVRDPLSGSPLLVPRGHSGREAEDCPLCFRNPDLEHRQSYTRASALADYLADFGFLWRWKMRYLARSLGRNPDLAALAGVEPYTTGFDKGEHAENRASGQRLDEIIERALDRGKISEKADYGTVIHALTEPGNDGVAPSEQAAKDRQSFIDEVERCGIKILGTELFTANDDLVTAGTFDHLVYAPGMGVVILDKKTSAKVHGADFRIQLSVYANADLYDWDTDTRKTLEEYLDSLRVDPRLLNRQEGLIAWIKDGKTWFYRVDLAAGYDAAHRAAWVRDHHRRGSHSWRWNSKLEKARAEESAALLAKIGEAASAEELTSLWKSDWLSWGPEHTAAAVARKAEL